MSGPRPTVDLGYPTEPHGRIPAFNALEEEAEFWDTHAITDYLDDLEPVEIDRPSVSTATLFLRLDPGVAETFDRRAGAQGADAATLARRWIEERLRQGGVAPTARGGEAG